MNLRDLGGWDARRLDWGEERGGREANGEIPLLWRQEGRGPAWGSSSDER